MVDDLCAGVVCTASNQCHDVGTCDPATGVCSDPHKPDGTSCEDGDFCTSHTGAPQTHDDCISGVCVLGLPVDCSDLNDQCNDGVCDPADGLCNAIPKDE